MKMHSGEKWRKFIIGITHEQRHELYGNTTVPEDLARYDKRNDMIFKAVMQDKTIEEILTMAKEFDDERRPA